MFLISYKLEYQSNGFVVLWESVCAVFHTSPALLSFRQNYFISVRLSRLHTLYHGCASYLRLKISGLSLHFMQNLHFFVGTKSSLHFASKTFLETELEALNDKEIFPSFTTIILATFTRFIFTLTAWDTIGTQQLKTDRWTQLVLWPQTARDTTDTQPFSENWPLDATSTLTPNSPGYNWYTAFFWKLTAGRN